MGKSKKRLEKKIKKFTANKDYDGLFSITQEIISERKNSLKEKIDDYIEKYKQYINKKKILSETELNEIWFYFGKLDSLSKVCDECNKLESELEKKNIYELMIEAENQYNEYLRGIKQ